MKASAKFCIVGVLVGSVIIVYFYSFTSPTTEDEPFSTDRSFPDQSSFVTTPRDSLSIHHVVSSQSTTKPTVSFQTVSILRPTTSTDFRKRSNSTVSPPLAARPPKSTFPPPPVSRKFTPLTQRDVDGVQMFVFFIGYPRSGHSIIGSMMDAHPDMIVAHEFMLFEKWPQQAAKLMNKAYLFNTLYKDSYDDATTGWRSAKEDKKGYTLQMKASWQGQFNHLKVIGDKSGGKASFLYHASPEEVQKSYRQLVDTVKIPVRTIHVIRNPYDMIATRVLYVAAYEQAPNSPAHKVPASETKKFDNPKMLMEEAKAHLELAEGSKNFTESCNLTVLEVYSEDFIEDPKATMKKICDFLDLECWDEYLQDCYDKTYKSMSKTRNVVNWTPEVLEYIRRELKHYPFFSRYIHSFG